MTTTNTTTTTTNTITGKAAMAQAKALRLSLHTYSDPTGEGREGREDVSEEYAAEVCAADPSLVYVEREEVVQALAYGYSGRVPGSDMRVIVETALRKHPAVTKTEIKQIVAEAEADAAAQDVVWKIARPKGGAL